MIRSLRTARRLASFSDTLPSRRDLPSWRETNQKFKEWQKRRGLKSSVSFNRRHHS